MLVIVTIIFPIVVCGVAVGTYQLRRWAYFGQLAVSLLICIRVLTDVPVGFRFVFHYLPGRPSLGKSWLIALATLTIVTLFLPDSSTMMQASYRRIVEQTPSIVPSTFRAALGVFAITLVLTLMLFVVSGR